MSLISLGGASSRLQHPRVSKPQSQEDINHPIIAPKMAGDERFALSPKPVFAHKALTFAGSNAKISTGVQLESKFIEVLRNSQNPDEKAGVIEMLGRAQSLNALPEIKKNLTLTQSVQVRSAAIKALGQIGDSTHEDGFTRGELGRELVSLYESRKTLLLSKPVDDAAPMSAEERDGLKEELAALAEAIGRLNISNGRDMLIEDFKQTFARTEQSLRSAQEMMQVMRMAESELQRSLEERYQKPIQEIIQEDINPMTFSKLKSETEVQFSDGSTMNLGEVNARIQQLQHNQKFNTGLMLGLMKGLTQRPRRQTLNAVALGLRSSHPLIKARAIEILGEQKALSYANDIQPNLTSKSAIIRDAAFSALVNCDEDVARQKVIEYLDPQAFSSLKSINMMSPQGLQAYRGFAAQVAEKGDHFIGTLSKIAVNPDFDGLTRQMALLPLSMMQQSPLADTLAPVTLKRAGDVIRLLAQNPPASDPQEKMEISLLATRLWVGMKEPQAVADALSIAAGSRGRLDDANQTQLLLAVSKALQSSYAETERGDKRDPDSFSHLMLDILATHKAAPSEKIEEARQQLKPDALSRLLTPADGDQVMSGPNNAPQVDEVFVKTLEKHIDQLRPLILKQLSHPSALDNRLLGAQLLGLFKDGGSTDALIDKTRDPLKGLVDWNRPTSFRGDPARYGVAMRSQSIQSLGRIGDSKAVEVLLDALDDPGLKPPTLAALSQLGDDANQKLSWQKLKKVRDRLTQVMNDPSTTRATRQVRIEAANALFQYKNGVDAVKDYIAKSDNPNFKRHALAGLLKNAYATDPKHPDHDLVKGLIYPGLGVEKLHAKGITGKGVEIAIIDGGYVDGSNSEAFQNRVKLPASFSSPEHYHPTMVMSTAAGNGKLKGVAPDAVAYSDKWPELGGASPMEVYKKIIEGKLRGENNIRVINNSWGFSDGSVVIHQDVREILREFKKVVDLAEKAGILFTFAAGNEGEDQGIPGLGTLTLFGLDVDKLTAPEKQDLNYILDKVVVVGAMNTQGFDEDRSKHRLADFSSVGDTLNSKLRPTVLAPGVDMMVYSWEPGQQTPKDLVNGTSFADPYLTGLAALMFQKNPDLTPAQARSILKATAMKIDGLSDTQQGYGVVDPLAAVAKAANYGKAKRNAAPPQDNNRPNAAFA